MDKSCKNCASCRKSYYSGWCKKLKKRVAYTGSCKEWKGKE